ncbi:hypothetical protein GCM10028857_16720 [Salinarchaeum chitinilyticum]
MLSLGGFIAARTIDLGEAIDAIRAADPILLAAAIAVYTASWPLRGRRYGDVLTPMDRRLRTDFLTSAVLLSQTANLAIPARGGDAVRAVVLKRRRAVDYATGVASLAVERVFDLAAIGALGGVALVWFVLAGDAAPVFDGLRSLDLPVGLFAGAAFGVAVAFVVGVAVASRSRIDPLALLPDRLRSGVHTATANLAVLARRPRAVAAVGTGSLAIWALDALTAILVLAAVAEPGVLPLLAVGTLATCAGNLAKVLPLTQGGVGLYEGAFAATVVALSPVAAPVALAAAVLDHALKNGITLAGGALAGLVLSRFSTAESGEPDRTGNLLGLPKK